MLIHSGSPTNSRYQVIFHYSPAVGVKVCSSTSFGSNSRAALLRLCFFVVPLMKYDSCSPAHNHNLVLCLISHHHRGLVFTMPSPHLQPQDGVIASKSYCPSRAGMMSFLRDWIYPALTLHYIVRCCWSPALNAEKKTDLAEITHLGFTGALHIRSAGQ